MKTGLTVLIAVIIIINSASAIAAYGDGLYGANNYGVSANNAPTITNVALRNAADTQDVSALDPNTEYLVKATLTDLDTLNDIKNMTVKLFYAKNGGYEATSNLKREHYNFTWEEAESGTTGTWTSLPAGYLNPSHTSTSPADTSAVTSYSFLMYFKLDPVAIPSGTTNYWQVKVVAVDESSSQVADTSKTFDVNKYSSLSALPATINYGTVNPGAKLTDNEITVTLTTNTQANITVVGHNLTNAVYMGEGGTGGENSNFKIPRQNLWVVNSSTQGGQGNKTFDETAQLIYKGYNATACALTTKIKGYNDAATRKILFGGSAPSKLKNLAYSATYTLALDASKVTPP